MRIPAIKKLAEEHTLDVLKAQRSALEDEQPLEIDIPGDDEGEKLTHIYGAIWVLEQVESNGTDIKTEVRNFSGRVRNSIG